MKRLLIIVYLWTCLSPVFSQTTNREQIMREIELKMRAVEKLSDNEIAYWSVMPEIVELMEQAGVVDTTYVRMLTRLGWYYYVQTDMLNANYAFGKAHQVLAKYDAIFNLLPTNKVLEVEIGYSWSLHQLGYCNEAIAIMRSVSDYILYLRSSDYLWQELDSYVQLANFYSSVGDECFNRDSTYYYLNKAIRGISAVKNPTDIDKGNERHLKHECAKTYINMGDYCRALNLIEREVLQIDVNSPNIEDGMMSSDYSLCQFRLGNYKEAMRNARLRLDERKRIVSNAYFVMSEQERSNMSPTYIDKDLMLHYLLSSVYYTKDYSIMGDIYDYILFVKQLQLRTSKQICNAIRLSGDMQLLDYYNEYNHLRKQLAESNSSKLINKDSLQARQNSIGRLLALHSNLILDNKAITWRDIQKQLGNGEAAIEFVSFDRFEGETIKDLHLYAAIVITRDCTHPILIPLTTEKHLTQWRTENPGDMYDIHKYGTALSKFVWLDICTYMEQQDINNLYFAPCGVLNQIAIESLPYDKESYISRHYNLTRLSTTQEIVNKHNLHPNKTATIYGGLFYRASAETMQQASTTRSAIVPLPASKHEITSIDSLLSDKQYQVTLFSQKKGTESSFKSLDGKRTSILHLSTHGFVNRPIEGDMMQRSGLVLSFGARAWEGKDIPSGTEDGILTAAEIATLDLSGTDIVVLSACNTALGEVTTEGVWGLQRAFKQAGAQTIIMSLWQVDDEATAVFMQYFYEALLKGRQTFEKAAEMDSEVAEHIFNYPHEALATAQRRMRQHPKFSSPYYWAAFIAVD